MLPIQQSQALLDRNAAKLAEAKEKLGPKWLLHPDNMVKRKSTTDKSKINLTSELSL